MNKKNVLAWIDEMTDSEVVELWNRYCILKQRTHDCVYRFNNSEEFFNRHFDTPWEAASCVIRSDLEPVDLYNKWAVITIYNYLKLSDNIHELMCIESVIEDIVTHPDDYPIPDWVKVD